MKIRVLTVVLADIVAADARPLNNDVFVQSPVVRLMISRREATLFKLTCSNQVKDFA